MASFRRSNDVTIDDIGGTSVLFQVGLIFRFHLVEGGCQETQIYGVWDSRPAEKESSPQSTFWSDVLDFVCLNLNQSLWQWGNSDGPKLHDRPWSWQWDSSQANFTDWKDWCSPVKSGLQWEEAWAEVRQQIKWCIRIHQLIKENKTKTNTYTRISTVIILSLNPGGKH